MDTQCCALEVCCNQLPGESDADYMARRVAGLTKLLAANSHDLESAVAYLLSFADLAPQGFGKIAYAIAEMARAHPEPHHS